MGKEIVVYIHNKILLSHKKNEIYRHRDDVEDPSGTAGWMRRKRGQPPVLGPLTRQWSLWSAKKCPAVGFGVSMDLACLWTACILMLDPELLEN